jgi:hypothetical protein
MLLVGPTGKWIADLKIEIAPHPGFAAYGPYWTLPPGRYEARLEFETDAGEGRPFVIMEVFSDDSYRGVAFVDGAKRRSGTASVQFEVHEDEAPTGELPLEIRLRSTGARGIARTLKVYPLGDPVQASPWIPFPDPPAHWPAEWSHAAGAGAGGDRRTLRSVLRSVARRLSSGA